MEEGRRGTEEDKNHHYIYYKATEPRFGAEFIVERLDTVLYIRCFALSLLSSLKFESYNITWKPAR